MTFTAFEIALAVVFYAAGDAAFGWVVRRVRDRRQERARKVLAAAAADAEKRAADAARRASAGECPRCKGSGVQAAWNKGCRMCGATGRVSVTKRARP